MRSIETILSRGTRLMGALALCLGALAGCSEGSPCPVPVDGGAPGGSCEAGSSSCKIVTRLLVTPTCGVETEYACDCISGSWRCAATNLEHNVCDYPDGGQALP